MESGKSRSGNKKNSVSQILINRVGNTELVNSTKYRNDAIILLKMLFSSRLDGKKKIFYSGPNIMKLKVPNWGQSMREALIFKIQTQHEEPKLYSVETGSKHK